MGESDSLFLYILIFCHIYVLIATPVLNKTRFPNTDQYCNNHRIRIHCPMSIPYLNRLTFFSCGRCSIQLLLTGLADDDEESYRMCYYNLVLKCCTLPHNTYFVFIGYHLAGSTLSSDISTI